MKVGTVPTGVAVTPDGKRIYVTNETDGTISVIETATNTVVDTIAVGTAPTAFGCFIGPNVIVAKGGPLSIANDNALTALGFGYSQNYAIDLVYGQSSLVVKLVPQKPTSSLANPTR